MSRLRPPTPADPARRRTALGVAALVALRLALDLRALWADPRSTVHWEEAWNVTAGYVALVTRRPDLLLTMQNKPFCGGCSVVGTLGAIAVELGGDRLLAWKVVPMMWTAATLVAAFVLLRRAAGPTAAWLGLLLLAVPTRGLQETSLMAWGNHAESGLWVLGTLLAALAGRHWRTGLLAGLGAWFCRTSVYGGLVAVMLAARHTVATGRQGRPLRRAAALLAGLAIGLSPLLLPQGGADAGTYDLAALSAPASWAERAGTLLSPARLAVAMLPPAGASRVDAAGATAGATAPLAGGLDGGSAAGAVLAGGVLLAGLLGASLGAWRAWRGGRPGPALPALLLAAFLAGWTVQGTPLPPVVPGGPVVDLRYLAPWLLLLPLGAAVAGPGWRRLLIVPALVAGIRAQRHPPAHALSSAPPTRLAALDLSTWARVAAERVPVDRIPASAEDAAVTGALAHARGLSMGLKLARTGGDWVSVAAGQPPTVCTGLGQGLVDHPWTEVELDRARDGLDALDPHRARAVGRGMALNLAFDLGRRTRDVDAQLALLSAGPSADAPPWLAAAAARALVEGCRPGSATCLARRLERYGRPVAVELAWGAGATLGGLHAEPAEIAATSQALARVDPAIAAAFVAAVRDPVVHPERATRVAALRREVEARSGRRPGG